MSTTRNEVSAAQKASWNKFSPGWKKWDVLTMAWLAPHGDAIVDHLKPAGSQVVLDVAAGTGEPSLTIAPMLSGGKVVVTDLAEGMLDVAREKAAAAGVKNLEFELADANDLPFADHTFDAVSCRLGFMFFPDIQRAANEMARVLKPGGRLATTVWGAPEKNFWITCMQQNIAKHIEVAPPPPGAPGMFRCARPGIVSEMFSAAGLKNVSEREMTCSLGISGAVEYWDMMTEVAAPFVAALSEADEATVGRVRADVLAAMDARFPDGKIAGSGTVIVAGQ